ncbi:MAG: nucleotidyltransferase domain-containing protein [Desulfobacterales bacterium]|nr:nucleotidyltransferase domain-containing protein [Desulfobacterales bacterium]
MDGLRDKLAILPQITQELESYHPQAVVLFGSLARHLQEMPLDHAPNDIDILVVGDNVPATIAPRYTDFPLELLRFRVHAFTAIARSLRYDPKPLALTRLYSNQLARQHARGVIAACLLLGPGYRAFGIEQIEIDGLEDERDYSVHRVLSGERWWRRISCFARERRGPVKHLSDKIVGLDRFVAP